jgi:hypothetical protein
MLVVIDTGEGLTQKESQDLLVRTLLATQEGQRSPHGADRIYLGARRTGLIRRDVNGNTVVTRRGRMVLAALQREAS